MLDAESLKHIETGAYRADKWWRNYFESFNSSINLHRRYICFVNVQFSATIYGQTVKYLGVKCPVEGFFISVTGGSLSLAFCVC